MSKENPLNNNCTMNCFNFESFLYNILSTRSNYKNFLNMNYIGICMKKYNSSVFGGHINTKLPDEKIIYGLQKCSFNREYVALHKIDIVEEIMFMLEQGYYTYLYLDEYFIPHRDAFRTFHFTHDNLINGYNQLLKKFSIFGYSKSRQVPTLAAIEDVRSGFKQLCQAHNLTSDIVFYRPGSIEIPYSIDYFFKELLEYKNGYHWLDRKDCYYGIDCYKGLHEYYNHLEMIGEIDIRLPYKLLEHKKLLIERVEYFLYHYSDKKKYQLLQKYKRKLMHLCNVLLIESNRYNLGKMRLLYEFEYLIDEILVNENKIFDIVLEI